MEKARHVGEDIRGIKHAPEEAQHPNWKVVRTPCIAVCANMASLTSGIRCISLRFDWPSFALPPFAQLNLSRLKYFIEGKRLDASKVITMKDLFDSGCVRRIKSGVKVLGKVWKIEVVVLRSLLQGAQQFDIPVHLEVSAVSEKAAEAIRRAGGSVKRVYYDRVGLRYLLKVKVLPVLRSANVTHLQPHKFLIPPKRAAPPLKIQMKGLYDDWGQNENQQQTTTGTETATGTAATQTATA